MLDYVKVDHEADPYSVAYTIALNALVARAKSKGELVAHLKKRGIEDEVASATIFRLQEAGLIDDEEFARAWTHYLSELLLANFALAGSIKILLMPPSMRSMMKMNTEWHLNLP